MNIGYLQVYNEVDWVGYIIDQAMTYCDKLIIIEGSQFASFKEITERSDDGTLDIINEKFDQYFDRIEILPTIRKNPNYRHNQAANFNLALKKCKLGDYFLPIDADEFYFEDHIKKIREMIEDGKVDYFISSGINLAFSFNWRIIYSTAEIKHTPSFFKKNRKLKFVKTHKPVNHGSNKVIDNSGKCMIHYKWVKTKERMHIRHLTSGFRPNMAKWFNENWDKIELVENKINKYYDGEFYLQKYNGSHPDILKHHPWKNIADIRKL